MTGTSDSEDEPYVAPLSGHVKDPSIDGTQAGGSEAGGSDKPSRESITAEDKEQALKYKSNGNTHIKESNYRDAVNMYTASLKLNPYDATVWCNRALAHSKLEENGLAQDDATHAIDIDPKYVKAYFRRGQAYLAIFKPDEALADFKVVVSLDPNNFAAKSQIETTQRLLRKLQFEAAITGKGPGKLASEKVLEMLQDGARPIPSDYKGPQIPADGIDAAFVDDLLKWFKDGHVIPVRMAWEIILGAYSKMKEEPSLTEVELEAGTQVNIIGDVHGQFFDFLHLLSLTGKPSPTNYLIFNGDFVDRGSWSTEIILVLMAYKSVFPQHVILNRGNHETSDMNKVYGFEGEVVKKYSDVTYRLFEEVFTALPLATLVTCGEPLPSEHKDHRPLHNGHRRFFVVHGGLFSDESVTFDDIKKVDRLKLKQPGQEGIMCEALWTDPRDEMGIGPSKRGVGISFGPDITAKWCRANGVTAVVRSHEVRMEGYSNEHNEQLITVFSAPNYVDQVGNKAAFMRVAANGTYEFETFDAQEHPPLRPMAYASGPNMFF